MEQDIIQEVADLTLELMDSNSRQAEITNRAYNELTRLTLAEERLEKEVEDLKHKVNSLHWGNDTHQMGS